MEVLTLHFFKNLRFGQNLKQQDVQRGPNLAQDVRWSYPWAALLKNLGLGP